MAFLKPDGKSGKPVAFDSVQLQTEQNVWKRFTKAEYEALPLSERIRYVLEKKAKFFRDGTEISPVEAMRGI
jgi:hypothetical protein